MGFNIPSRILARLYLVQLSVCAFGLSSTLACDDFGLKNVNNDGGGWIFCNFTGSTDCVLCFRRERGNSDHPELVLPCSNRLLQTMKRKVQILYQFRRSGMPNPAHQDRVPLSVEGEEGRSCQRDYMNATNIDRTIHSIQRQRSYLGSEKTLVKDLDPMLSYRLKIQTSVGNILPSSIVCLIDVTFIETEMPFAATTFIPPATSDVKKPNQGSTVIGAGSSATVPLKTATTNMETQRVSVTEQTNTTSSRSSSNGSTLGSTLIGGSSATVPHKTATTNMMTQGEQGQSYFSIWVIFVIIAVVVISICALAGVFIRRRKHHDHQPANNVNPGNVNGTTNGIKDNMENDKVVVPNPTYGQEPVNEKEDEYHSYTEIDVKVPGNTEMIYNSAYESPPATRGMVYNSAYESEETNNDMIYNSAYESSPSN